MARRFRAAELTSQSEHVSGGAVQIGNAIEEKKVLDVLLAARDRGLFNAVTDCGAGGFQQRGGRDGREDRRRSASRSVPAEVRGAVVHGDLDFRGAGADGAGGAGRSAGRSSTNCAESEGVEATVIGRFVPSGRLHLYYDGNCVADLDDAVFAQGPAAGGAEGGV